MSNTVVAENKMGVQPIPKLLISMSLPMILSMLVQACYNIVDSIFIAQMNEDALAAVSLAFPIQNLMIAVSAGTCVGVNALLSRSLGEHKPDQANRIAKNGIFLAVISSLVFVLFGILGSHAFFSVQTSDSQIVEYGHQYMSVVCIFSIGIFLQTVFERLLQSTGKTIFNMITQTTGAVINIIMDPILIFGMFGFPKMGVTGAAVATVFGQIVAALLAIFFNCKFNTELNLNIRGFKPCKQTIGYIYKIGVPSIMMQSIGSLTTFAMNNILLMFSSTAATVFGVYFKLQSFVFMPVFGLTNGMIPIIAYNYGAKNKKRIFATLKLSIVLAVSIMAVGLAAFQIMPVTMLRLFEASDNMIKIGVPALRIISLSFVFAGYAIVCSCMFQALGNGVYSLIISACRQLIVILPSAFIFAKVFGLHMVWWAYPLAEIVSLVLCTLLLKKIIKEKISVI